VKRFLLALAWFSIGASPALAAGTNSHEISSQRPAIARAGFPTPSLPDASLYLTGCGHGRYRDSRTHGCVGPADLAR
jgi:hypothetical protein